MKKELNYKLMFYILIVFSVIIISSLIIVVRAERQHSVAAVEDFNELISLSNEKTEVFEEIVEYYEEVLYGMCLIAKHSETDPEILQELEPCDQWILDAEKTNNF